ncbi:MAG: archease [Candidatus Woesearchaeota archaeon]
MSYKYLDHRADVGVLIESDSLKGAFVDGAKALFNLMVNIAKVERKDKVDLEVSGTSVDKVFVEWLNELIAQADIHNMVFCDFDVDIKPAKGGFSVRGAAWGDIIDAKKHEIKSEVKGATYYGLRYEKKGGKHIIQCVLDM